MLSKRPKPYPDELPAAKRLAANVRDLYAANEISCRRTQSLINDMQDANVKHKPGPVQRNLNSKNLARRLRRAISKHNKWPPDYVARVRVLDRLTGEETWEKVAMQAPHLILEMLRQFGSADKLQEISEMDPQSLAHLSKCRNQAGCPTMTGYGLHCDGVPHSWDREESAEVFSLNLPGLAPPWKNMRIPLFSIPHSSIGPHTWDDLMEIIAWSLRCAWQGFHPEADHNGDDFTDAYFLKRKGKRLLGRSCLVEIRGDWKMLAETFHLPRWNEKGGCCWSCTCTTKQVCMF